MSERRRLAAIVAADVVGYSRLMGRDESGTLARLRAHRRERFEPILARRGGRLVKLTGDGALAEFASAVEAVSAAIEFQQAMADANAGVPDDVAIVFRIGVHLGDLIVEGDDLYGDGVNVAARLEAQAPAGGIVVSYSVRDAVDGRLKAALRDLGDLTLKNIERLVRAFRVEWNPADWLTPVGAPAAPNANDAPPPLPDKPSIAVLPFQNMSGDPEQEYFADGMVEDIITALSRFPQLLVVARNSSFTYKGKSIDVRQIGRELGVRYVLEGSVRRGANRLRITGQLIDTHSGNHVWANRYEGTPDDVFDLQDRITAGIVASLEPTITQLEITRAQAKATENLTAYDLYLRAYAMLSKRSPESFEQRLALLYRAVELDTRYSTAWAFIAHSHYLVGIWGWAPLEQSWPPGLKAARQAAESGGNDPRALAWAGAMIPRMGGTVEEGRRHTERALILAPDSLHVQRMAAWLHLAAGEHEVAIARCRRVIELAPLDPGISDAQQILATALFFLGRHEEALGPAEEALLALPDESGRIRLVLMLAAMVGRSPAELETLRHRFQSATPATSIAVEMRKVAHYRRPDQALLEAALRKAGVPE